MNPLRATPNGDGTFAVAMRRYRSNEFGALKGRYSQADVERMRRSFAWGEADNWAGWMR